MIGPSGNVRVYLACGVTECGWDQASVMGRSGLLPVLQHQPPLRAADYPAPCYARFQHDGNLTRAGAACRKPQHLSQMSHGQPSLCRHQSPLLHREVLAGRTAYSFRASTL